MAIVHAARSTATQPGSGVPFSVRAQAASTSVTAKPVAAATAAR
ncbi:hypothetical protein QFZ27_002603 [Inquilinus ginsengisoli]